MLGLGEKNAVSAGDVKVGLDGEKSDSQFADKYELGGQCAGRQQQWQ